MYCSCHGPLCHDPAQALEYLLWASISLELSIPLMTAKYLPWIATLYCAVCHCYYDNQAVGQAEVKDMCYLHPDTYEHTHNHRDVNRLFTFNELCHLLLIICLQFL